MNFRKLSVFLLAALFAVSAYSGDRGHHKTEIKVVTDDGDGETSIVFDSDDLNVDLHAMRLGENQSVVDKHGQAVLITRTEDGYSLQVDGKTIDMPAFSNAGGNRVWVHGDPAADVDVKVMRGGMTADAVDHDGVMIFSGKEIDAATQQVIEAALEAAGHSNVSFAGGDKGGQHHVRVIKKMQEVREVSE